MKCPDQQCEKHDGKADTISVCQFTTEVKLILHFSRIYFPSELKD